jgi:ElaB/YqjD/DUF883 family membrane-anchored ribosome-binding protein
MNSAFDIYRMMATAVDSFTRYAWSNPQKAPSEPSDNRQRMWRLYVAFVNSGYRYLARWAEISSRRWPQLASALPTLNGGLEVSDRELAELIDNFRAYLREMAELPAEESQRLEAEIDAVMRHAEGNAAPKKRAAAQKKRPAARRRVRVKP